MPITQITGIGASGPTFLATPSSANLRSFLTDETGTGAAVFATSPAITTPDIVGVAAATNANAGSVGEYVESNIASGSAIAAGATGVAKTLTSISLTAGDWDVSGVVQWIPLSTTVMSAYAGSISTTTNTLDITNGRWSSMVLQTGVTGAGNTDGSSAIIPCRFSLASTTTIYLVGRATYTTAGLNMYGILRARRVR
jgi:hypothetical protein